FLSMERETKLIEPLAYHVELEVEKERTRQKELEVKKTQLDIEKVRIEFEMMKIKFGIKDSNVCNVEEIQESHVQESHVAVEESCVKVQERNPLFKFLLENTCYQEGNMVLME